jgi:hypothetical protein
MRGLSADRDVNMEANKPRSSANMDVSFLLNMDTRWLLNMDMQVIDDPPQQIWMCWSSADMDASLLRRSSVNTVIIATGV